MVAACGARTWLDGADRQSLEPDGGDGAEAASTFARPSCGTVDPAAHQGCNAIHELTLSNASVVDAGPKNGVWPGQTATIEVQVVNTGSQASGGPCIGVATDNPLASVLPPNPSWELFTVLPGAQGTLRAGVRFDASIPAWTIVHLTIWIDLVNAGCVNGPAVPIDVLVQ
jgi:hypothetical protein